MMCAASHIRDDHSDTMPLIRLRMALRLEGETFARLREDAALDRVEFDRLCEERCPQRLMQLGRRRYGTLRRSEHPHDVVQVFCRRP